MRTKTTILFFVFLLILPIAFSQPPFQEGSGTDGLHLRISELPAVKVNQAYTLKIHVFNETSGYPITQRASCYLHLYNNSLSHIAEISTNTVDHTFDYELAVSANNFTQEGFYPYIVQCNTSKNGGFIASYIEATVNGYPRNENPTLLIAILLLPMIFIGLLLYGSLNMSEEHTPIKITIWLLIPIFFFLSMHFSLLMLVQYYPIAMLQNLVGSSIYWIGILFGVFLTYFIIYLIYTMIQYSVEKKQKKMEY